MSCLWDNGDLMLAKINAYEKTNAYKIKKWLWCLIIAPILFIIACACFATLILSPIGAFIFAEAFGWYEDNTWW